MTPERHKELMDNTTMPLAVSEAREGWHFCPDWDGLLMKIGEETCPCLPWTEEELKEQT